MGEHWSISIRAHLDSAEQVYFLLQMVDDGSEPMPVAFSSDRNAISVLCAELNDALSWETEMFTIEHLFTETGGQNYSFYRDADKMGWIRS